MMLNYWTTQRVVFPTQRCYHLCCKGYFTGPAAVYVQNTLNKKNPKPRNMPISSLDRYNCCCLSSHAVIIVSGRSSVNPLQRLWLDTIWATTVIHETRSWGKNCAFRSRALLWGGTEDCLGSAGKAAWLWYRKQTQIHMKTKVTPKGWSLSDT